MSEIDPTQKAIAVTIQSNGIIRLLHNGHMIGTMSDDRTVNDPDILKEASQLTELTKERDELRGEIKRLNNQLGKSHVYSAG